MPRRASIFIALFALACVSGKVRAEAPAAADFWSFQPVVKPATPTVSNASWVRNPIDAFILARLDREHLAPAAPATKDALIRRLTYDLIGLPPTPAEVRAFRADTSPDAYDRLVERLLASPHYGERWGRHWLDVARYVPGRISFPGVKNTRGDQAYRDYVVRAFNTDKPYDRFVTEQLAGDLLPPTPDRQTYFDQITAPAFLSIGAWFDMETDPNRLRLEMIDEQINATSKAFLGLSVACARCHDHKFDPIPTEDYYALGGIFGSTRLVGDFSEFWRDGRVRQLRPLAMPGQVEANDRVRVQIDAKQAEVWKLLSDQHARLAAGWRAEEGRYRKAAGEIASPFVKRIEAEQFDGQDNLRIAQLMRDGKAVEVLETQTPGAQWVKYKIDVPESGGYRLEALYSSDEPSPAYLTVNGTNVTESALNQSTGGWGLARQRWDIVATFDLRKGLNFLRLGIKNGNFPRLDRLRLFAHTDATEQQITQTAAAAGLDARVLANFVHDPENPWPTVAGIEPYLDDATRATIANLRDEATALAETIQPYEQIIAVSDQPTPVDLPVHLRGETYSMSQSNVPRGTLRLLDRALPRPGISAGSSGRLELAQWIADPRNPLTARVMANRVWGWHFGRGIVATPSDFGLRGEPPTHPELLDWLASELVEHGGSIKHLHRLIVTSNTYRMSSTPAERDVNDSRDALLSHFPRQRLDAEAIYDAMRSTTNMIPRQDSGTPLDYEKSAQRAMYVLTNGRAPPGLGGEVRKFFTLFDYDLTTATAPIEARRTSQTAAQSLFWMNSPLVKYMADKFAARLLRMDRLDDARRVDMAYLLALGREPGPEVKAQALTYIEHATRDRTTTPGAERETSAEHATGSEHETESTDDQDAARHEAWAQFCQALYGTAEFRFVE